MNVCKIAKTKTNSYVSGLRWSRENIYNMYTTVISEWCVCFIAYIVCGLDRREYKFTYVCFIDMRARIYYLTIYVYRREEYIWRRQQNLFEKERTTTTTNNTIYTQLEKYRTTISTATILVCACRQVFLSNIAISFFFYDECFLIIISI